LLSELLDVTGSSGPLAPSAEITLDSTLTKADSTSTSTSTSTSAKGNVDTNRRQLTASSIIASGGHNLSVGEKQCVQLARCCCSNASVLILDEITAHLDLRCSQAALRILKRELCDRRGKSVLFIAHRATDLLLCDQVCLVSQGQVVMKGKPEHVVNELTRGAAAVT